MAPPPEYDKEPKAPDKSASNISCEETKALHNLVNDQQNNTDSKTVNATANAEVENNKHVETLDDGQLRALLDEAITYKCPKDREGKSSLFKELLEEVEQDEQACEAAARNLNVGRRQRGGRGGGARHSVAQSNSLQDLVAALAAEPAPRRHQRHHNAPPATSVSARTYHGGSLPSGVDTSFLLGEEASTTPRGGGANYLATVRCINPPPLSERRVSASDAPQDDAARRPKPAFPMTYTARATLEIGSGGVSGRATTTTTASNQVRTRALTHAPIPPRPPIHQPMRPPALMRHSRVPMQANLAYRQPLLLGRQRNQMPTVAEMKHLVRQPVYPPKVCLPKKKAPTAEQIMKQQLEEIQSMLKWRPVSPNSTKNSKVTPKQKTTPHPVFKNPILADTLSDCRTPSVGPPDRLCGKKLYTGHNYKSHNAHTNQQHNKITLRDKHNDDFDLKTIAEEQLNDLNTNSGTSTVETNTRTDTGKTEKRQDKHEKKHVPQSQPLRTEKIEEGQKKDNRQSQLLHEEKIVVNLDKHEEKRDIQYQILRKEKTEVKLNTQEEKHNSQSQPLHTKKIEMTPDKQEDLHNPQPQPSHTKKRELKLDKQEGKQFKILRKEAIQEVKDKDEKNPQSQLLRAVKVQGKQDNEEKEHNPQNQLLRALNPRMTCFDSDGGGSETKAFNKNFITQTQQNFKNRINLNQKPLSPLTTINEKNSECDDIMTSKIANLSQSKTIQPVETNQTPKIFVMKNPSNSIKATAFDGNTKCNDNVFLKTIQSRQINRNPEIVAKENTTSTSDKENTRKNIVIDEKVSSAEPIQTPKIEENEIVTKSVSETCVDISRKNDDIKETVQLVEANQNTKIVAKDNETKSMATALVGDINNVINKANKTSETAAKENETKRKQKTSKRCNKRKIRETVEPDHIPNQIHNIVEKENESTSKATASVGYNNNNINKTIQSGVAGSTPKIVTKENETTSIGETSDADCKKENDLVDETLQTRAANKNCKRVAKENETKSKDKTPYEYDRKKPRKTIQPGETSQTPKIVEKENDTKSVTKTSEGDNKRNNSVINETFQTKETNQNCKRVARENEKKSMTYTQEGVKKIKNNPINCHIDQIKNVHSEWADNVNKWYEGLKLPNLDTPISTCYQIMKNNPTEYISNTTSFESNINCTKNISKLNPNISSKKTDPVRPITNWSEQFKTFYANKKNKIEEDKITHRDVKSQYFRDNSAPYCRNEIYMSWYNRDSNSFESRVTSGHSLQSRKQNRQLPGKTLMIYNTSKSNPRNIRSMTIGKPSSEFDEFDVAPLENKGVTDKTHDNDVPLVIESIGVEQGIDNKSLIFEDQSITFDEQLSNNFKKDCGNLTLNSTMGSSTPVNDEVDQSVNLAEQNKIFDTLGTQHTPIKTDTPIDIDSAKNQDICDADEMKSGDNYIPNKTEESSPNKVVNNVESVIKFHLKFAESLEKLILKDFADYDNVTGILVKTEKTSVNDSNDSVDVTLNEIPKSTCDSVNDEDISSLEKSVSCYVEKDVKSKSSNSNPKIVNPDDIVLADIQTEDSNEAIVISQFSVTKQRLLGALVSVGTQTKNFQHCTDQGALVSVGTQTKNSQYCADQQKLRGALVSVGTQTTNSQYCADQQILLGTLVSVGTQTKNSQFYADQQKLLGTLNSAKADDDNFDNVLVVENKKVGKCVEDKKADNSALKYKTNTSVENNLLQERIGIEEEIVEVVDLNFKLVNDIEDSIISIEDNLLQKNQKIEEQIVEVANANVQCINEIKKAAISDEDNLLQEKSQIAEEEINEVADANIQFGNDNEEDVIRVEDNLLQEKTKIEEKNVKSANPKVERVNEIEDVAIRNTDNSLQKISGIARGNIVQVVDSESMNAMNEDVICVGNSLLINKSEIQKLLMLEEQIAKVANPKVESLNKGESAGGNLLQEKLGITRNKTAKISDTKDKTNITEKETAQVPNQVVECVSWIERLLTNVEDNLLQVVTDIDEVSKTDECVNENSDEINLSPEKLEMIEKGTIEAAVTNVDMHNKAKDLPQEKMDVTKTANNNEYLNETKDVINDEDDLSQVKLEIIKEEEEMVDVSNPIVECVDQIKLVKKIVTNSEKFVPKGEKPLEKDCLNRSDVHKTSNNTSLPKSVYDEQNAFNPELHTIDSESTYVIFDRPIRFLTVDNSMLAIQKCINPTDNENTRAKPKKTTKLESSKKKKEVDRNAQRNVTTKLMKDSAEAETSDSLLEVDSAIPFSCITTPEVVASCNTTPSAQSAVAADPKPRSVLTSSFNGLPLARPNYGTMSTTEEYKKPLDENGNSVTGFSSPLLGSSQHKKPRRKKSSKNETVIKSHHIDGYQGNKDLNEVLRFIESNADAPRSNGPKLRKARDVARHDEEEKPKKRERRKDKQPPQRAASLEEVAVSSLRELTTGGGAAAGAGLGAGASASAGRAPPAKPERRSWGDDFHKEEEPAPGEFQTVTKKRRWRRREGERDDAREERECERDGTPAALPPLPRARRVSAPPSDRSDSNDDDSVHSLHSLPALNAGDVNRAAVSYADIARAANIPDLIESCNFYAEETVAVTVTSIVVPPQTEYPALEPRRRHKPAKPAPPTAPTAKCKERTEIISTTVVPAERSQDRSTDRSTDRKDRSTDRKDRSSDRKDRSTDRKYRSSDRKERSSDRKYRSSDRKGRSSERLKERSVERPQPTPDVVRRPPVILLDSTRHNDIQGITFGFDINEQLLTDGSRRPRCDLVADAVGAPQPEPQPQPQPAAAPPARPAAPPPLRYLPPPAPVAPQLAQIVNYVGSAWEDVVRCSGGKVRYFSE